jgi:coproporphyrinogen III oxidase-like Fe-S oxidoreductase
VGAAPLSTVFFGGGTPSLVPPPLVGRILAALRTRFALSPTAEISMEVRRPRLRQTQADPELNRLLRT